MKLLKTIFKVFLVKEKPKEVFVVTPPHRNVDRVDWEYAERVERMERVTNRRERMRRGERFFGQDDIYAS